MLTLALSAASSCVDFHVLLSQTHVVQNCKRLAVEFMHYIIESRSLRKVFLSIKGIYYQAEIKGQTITWITPYTFTQKVGSSVQCTLSLVFPFSLDT